MLSQPALPSEVWSVDFCPLHPDCPHLTILLPLKKKSMRVCASVLGKEVADRNTVPLPAFFSQYFLEVLPVGLPGAQSSVLRVDHACSAVYAPPVLSGETGGFCLLLFKITLNQTASWCVCWDGFLQGSLRPW